MKIRGKFLDTMKMNEIMHWRLQFTYIRDKVNAKKDTKER